MSKELLKGSEDSTLPLFGHRQLPCYEGPGRPDPAPGALILQAGIAGRWHPAVKNWHRALANFPHLCRPTDRPCSENRGAFNKTEILAISGPVAEYLISLCLSNHLFIN